MPAAPEIRRSAAYRLQRALQVRDAALPWLREHGNVMTLEQRGGSPGTLLEGELDGFSFLHRTPFSGLHLRPMPRNYAEAVILQNVEVLPYELDIRSGGKRLILEWASDGRTHVRQFSAGDWEAALLRRIDKERASAEPSM